MKTNRYEKLLIAVFGDQRKQTIKPNPNIKTGPVHDIKREDFNRSI